MNIEHVSMTDTPEQIAEASKLYGMDSEVVTGEPEVLESLETESEPAEPAAAEPAVTEEAPTGGEGTTAAEQAPAGEVQEQKRWREGTPKWAQDRFDELSAKKNEALEKQRQTERELANARAELERLRAGGSPDPEAEPAAPAAEAVAPQPKPKPKRADFMDADDPDEAYIEALTDWKQEQSAAALQAELAKVNRQLEEERTDRVRDAEARKWEERRATVLRDLPDFEAVVEGPDAPAAKIMMTPTALETINRHPQPEHLIYWLATHPEEAAAMANETVASDDNESKFGAIIASSRWIARIEADMGLRPGKRPTAQPPALRQPNAQPQPPAAAPATPQPSRPRVPPLPAPVTPVGAGSGPAGARKLSDIKDPVEYRKAREAGIK